MHLTEPGRFMDAPLAARLEREVLHGVGEVYARAIETGGGERTVENLSGRPHEWSPCDVLRIPRLLPDQEDFGVARPFAEDDLRSGLVKRQPRHEDDGWR